MSAIEAQQLAQRVPGGLQAVAGVDLDVAEGEIYAFLGPNGAGKTTTVRILTTLLRPTGGGARVAGYDVAAEPGAVRRRIGVALQEAALDPLMTGRELIRLQATLHGLSREGGHGAGRALLERVDLTKPQTAGSVPTPAACAAASTSLRRWSTTSRCSSSTSRRPGLDPVSRKAIWEEVRELNDDGTTVFLTTQYLEEADQLADRVGIIYVGKLVAEGTPMALKAEIGHPRLELSLVEQAGQGGAGRGGPRPVRPAAADAGRGGDGRARARGLRGRSGGRRTRPGGLDVESLDLVEPTLDDVFVHKTGQHLEGGRGGPAKPRRRGVSATGGESA